MGSKKKPWLELPGRESLTAVSMEAMPLNKLGCTSRCFNIEVIASLKNKINGSVSFSALKGVLTYLLYKNQFPLGLNPAINNF